VTNTQKYFAFVGKLSHLCLALLLLICIINVSIEGIINCEVSEYYYSFANSRLVWHSEMKPFVSERLADGKLSWKEYGEIEKEYDRLEGTPKEKLIQSVK